MLSLMINNVFSAMIKIYTDGACDFNTRNANNIGGWSYVVVDADDNQLIFNHGHMRNTTNNRMELLAAIKALTEYKSEDNIVVYSDSTYLVNTMMLGWKRNKNHDLWTQLDELKTPNVEFIHVKGHNGDKYNEMCDKLATRKPLDKNTLEIDLK
jgi:ribonuclease HI